MLHFFRSMFKSKIGLAIAFVFLGIIALAFASADVSSTGTFGGVAGGDRVAVVGDAKIGTADLSRAANTALDRVRAEQDPTASMASFLAAGGLGEVVDALIDRAALRGYAQQFGLRAGDNLINSEIRKIGAFRGADGNFSEETYRQMLAQQGVTDAQVRDDLGTALLAQQQIIPASFGTTIPDALARRYAQLFKERRQGSIALLPAAAYAPAGAPTAGQLQSFYTANRELFIRPERRVVRFATFDSAALGDAIEPTDAEIAARYREDAARFAARETRSVTQLIVPTEAAARSLSQRVAGGASLEQVAQSAGLRTASLENLDKAALRSQTSAAVADAYFAATEGSVTAPARGALGWHVGRIDTVTRTPARSLAQARTELSDTLREEKRAKGLADLAAQVEEQIADGATLPEIARDLKLTVQSTPPITATGQVYGSESGTAPAILAPALATVFQMEPQEPEIAPIEGGAQYLLFEAGAVTPSAAAPLGEIRDTVVSAWRQSEGDKAARAAADRVLARLRGGATMAAAMAAEQVPLPGADSIDLTRQDFVNRGDQRIPPPLALLFSMAQGTAKKLEAGGRAGWFVVDLDSIALDDIDRNDPLIAQAKAQLGPALGNEYVDQMRMAMRAELGVERNEAAIEAVRKQLAGN